MMETDPTLNSDGEIMTQQQQEENTEELYPQFAPYYRTTSISNLERNTYLPSEELDVESREETSELMRKIIGIGDTVKNTALVVRRDPFTLVCNEM